MKANKTQKPRKDSGAERALKAIQREIARRLRLVRNAEKRGDPSSAMHLVMACNSLGQAMREVQRACGLEVTYDGRVGRAKK